MSEAAADGAEGGLLGVIADEETVTGFLLAGVGDINMRLKKNFLTVSSSKSLKKWIVIVEYNYMFSISKESSIFAIVLQLRLRSSFLIGILLSL